MTGMLTGIHGGGHPSNGSGPFGRASCLGGPLHGRREGRATTVAFAQADRR